MRPHTDLRHYPPVINAGNLRVICSLLKEYGSVSNYFSAIDSFSKRLQLQVIISRIDPELNTFVTTVVRPSIDIYSNIFATTPL